MSYLEQIPTEIALLIVQHVPEFFGLDSLLRVSPRVRAIFSRDPITITENVLLSCPMTSQVILQLYQADAIIRAPGSRYSSLDEFSRDVAGDDVNSIDLRDCFTARDHSDIHSTLRNMVRVAAHIQRLACACLSVMLRNLHTVAHANPALPRSREMAGTRRPSWVEEYRVYRALWHLQVFSDIYRASCPDRVLDNSSHSHWGGWNWPSDDSRSIGDWYSMARGFDSVIMAETRQVSRILSTVVGPEHCNAHLDSAQIPLYTSLEPVRSLDEPVWCPPPLPRNSDVERAWHQCISFSRRRASQWTDFQFFRSLDVRDDSFRKVLRERPSAEFLCLHDLGLFLWDRWRLYCLGIVFTHPHEQQLIPEDEGVIRDPEAYVAPTSHVERWDSLVEKAFKLSR